MKNIVALILNNRNKKMQISFGHQAIKKEIDQSCTVIEHSLDHKLLDMAISTISGRYPDKKRAMKLFLSCRPAWNKDQHQLID